MIHLRIRKYRRVLAHNARFVGGSLDWWPEDTTCRSHRVDTRIGSHFHPMLNLYAQFAHGFVDYNVSCRFSYKPNIQVFDDQWLDVCEVDSTYQCGNHSQRMNNRSLDDDAGELSV